jgi:hypothetical protein
MKRTEVTHFIGLIQKDNQKKDIALCRKQQQQKDTLITTNRGTKDFDIQQELDQMNVAHLHELETNMEENNARILARVLELHAGRISILFNTLRSCVWRGNQGDQCQRREQSKNSSERAKRWYVTALFILVKSAALKLIKGDNPDLLALLAGFG